MIHVDTYMVLRLFGMYAKSLSTFFLHYNITYTSTVQSCYKVPKYSHNTFLGVVCFLFFLPSSCRG
jgi:hypothetical protein